MHKCPASENTEANTRKKSSVALGVAQVSNAKQTSPDAATTTCDSSMISSGESPTSRRRVETSRRLPHSTDSTPSSAQALKALDPGLMTSSAPKKPTPTAVQLRQPTCSPRNRADA